eukprot:UN04378
MYCTSCDEHIAQGVRYNAKKDQCGEYFSTKLWRFTFSCHLCKARIIIETDPQARDYKCVVGCRRARSGLFLHPK